MNLSNRKTSTNKFLSTLIGVSAIAFSALAMSASLDKKVDDFSNEKTNSLGIDRIFLSDTTAGGKTSADLSVKNGVLTVKGKIVPPRGQPGWASSVLPLGPMNQPQDASKYQGVKLLVKVNSGMLSVSANSTKVVNFDYHAAPIMVAADGKFHEVKVPFNSMKRAWSEQTKLDPATLASLSIVAFDLKPSEFSYEIDEVSFY